MGSCETHDDLAAEIADEADVVSVLFDYRLAPEHPHPAQIEDAATVLDWMQEHGPRHRHRPRAHHRSRATVREARSRRALRWRWRARAQGRCAAWC